MTLNAQSFNLLTCQRYQKDLYTRTGYTYYKEYTMAGLTLAIPDDVKKEMEKFPEINWSEIARAAIKRRLLILTKLREFTEDSDITEEEAYELGERVSKSLSKRHRK